MSGAEADAIPTTRSGAAAAADQPPAWVLGGVGAVLLVSAWMLLWYRRHRREAALEQENAALAAKTAQLEATLASMSDGIMMMDAELRLLAWNDKFPDLAGVPRDILCVGLPLADILRAQAEAGEFGSVDVEAEVTRRIDLIRAGASASANTVHRVRPGGSVLELRRNPIAGGGFVTLYTGVTARQHAEERLRQAERLAALGRVAAGIVHDFNNLLSSVIGNAELLERTLRAEAQQQVHTIIESAERGVDLVRRLLTFARKQSLEPVPADLNKIVHGMQTLLQSTTGRTVQTRLLLAPDLWPALVDPAQIEHVILNLAINARDAMPEGGVMTIETANLASGTPRPDGLPAADFVSLAVSDTGIGMTEEVRRNAFEPFFTTKPAGYGTGLGLSQVYGLATQSGGGVEIDSTLGVGTTVTVFLPRADDGAVGERIARAVARA